MNGDAKTGNKFAQIQNKALIFLYEHGSLAALQPMLSHDDFNVRLYAAYALLPLFEEECKEVLLKIANGDYRIYGIQGLNAEMTLKAWENAELYYPYQSEFGKKPSPIEEDKTSSKANNIEGAERKEEFSLETLRLSRIFECPPTGDNDLRNEQSGFYVSFDPVKQEIKIRVNTFVNPYTQDVKRVYQERLERFETFKHIATISADEPSKLGFMQIVLTIHKENATDDVLIQIKDVIYVTFNEWKQNESLVWFKAEYHRAVCYFEGSWWMPHRAIVKKKRGYERYDFSDEMKFDEEMWEIANDEYDKFENSDSFALIDSKEFQKIWETTSVH